MSVTAYFFPQKLVTAHFLAMEDSKRPNGHNNNNNNNGVDESIMMDNLDHATGRATEAWHPIALLEQGQADSDHSDSPPSPAEKADNGPIILD